MSCCSIFCVPDVNPCIILLLILMVEASWMNSLTSRLQRKKNHNALFCFFYLFDSIGEYKL